MKYLTYLISILTFAFISCNSKEKKEIIPIYIEPYYNSQPFKIAVGTYSEQLKTDDQEKILALAETIKSNIDQVNIETLFVLATRLYDLNKKDEAAYWYYTASYRRNVLKQLLNDPNPGTSAWELTQALDAYKSLLGEFVNGYAFGDIDKNISTCQAVIANNSKMKSPKSAYPQLKFDDNKLEASIQNATADMQEMINFMEQDKDYIKEQRIKNGVENKY